MKKVSLKFSLVSLSIFAAYSPVVAADDSFRQHDAHEHGSVEFNIAQDGDNLLMEIIAPGADVLGFEHPPRTEEQENKLANSISILDNPENIITLSKAAQCKVVDKLVNHSFEKVDDDHGEHEHENHHDHDDKHHKDHDDHHGHDDKHHKDHDDHHGHDELDSHGHDMHPNGHGSFNITYQYECKNIDKLDQFDVLWFSKFPVTEKITVNALMDSQQILSELSAQKNTIKL